MTKVSWNIKLWVILWTARHCLPGDCGAQKTAIRTKKQFSSLLVAVVDSRSVYLEIRWNAGLIKITSWKHSFPTKLVLSDGKFHLDLSPCKQHITLLLTVRALCARPPQSATIVPHRRWRPYKQVGLMFFLCRSFKRNVKWNSTGLISWANDSILITCELLGTAVCGIMLSCHKQPT